MKRRLYGITFLMVLGLSILNLSCSKEEVNSFVVPTGSILVSEPGEVGSTHFNTDSKYFNAKLGRIADEAIIVVSIPEDDYRGNFYKFVAQIFV